MTCWVGLVPLWRCDLSYYHLALSYYHLDWNPACLLLPLPPSLLLRTRRLKSKLPKACMRESTGKRFVENQSWVQNLALSLTLNLKFLTYKIGSDNPFCAVLCSVSQSYLTLWFSWARACQSPLSMGILQARKLEWVAMPSSRDSSQPRDRIRVSHIAQILFHLSHQKRPGNLMLHIKWPSMQGCFSHIRLFATPWTVASRLLCP